MNSMTGFGAARVSRHGWVVSSEVSSINKKGLEIHLNLPDALSASEGDIRKIIQDGFSRGRVQLSVKLTSTHPEKQLFDRLNIKAIKQYHALLSKLGKELGGVEAPSWAYLLNLPGVMKDNGYDLPEEIVGDALDAVKQSLEKLAEARQREGTFLSKELQKQFQFLEKKRVVILAAAPTVTEQHRAALLKRLDEAGLPLDPKDDRIVKEVAFYADRSDISEELTRLKSHLLEGVRLLKSDEAAGRKMDFLIQEIHREINTVGSKCSNYAISKEVIEFKAEIEKIREQVQNLE